MDEMTQPPMPTGVPQNSGKKNAVLWIVLVVLALAIIAIWLAMGSTITPNTGTNIETLKSQPPVSNDEELNAIGSDLQNINVGDPTNDFRAIDADVNAL